MMHLRVYDWSHSRISIMQSSMCITMNADMHAAYTMQVMQT